jgi:N-acetylglucosaminyldiphosphoundecaprenol N-acetyl-beta-D-mannosaminyltransferase
MAGGQQSRVNAFGVAIDALNMRSAVNAVFLAVKSGSNSYVCLTGAHGIVEARRNPAFANALKNATLVMPDGMPTVWIAKWQGFTEVDRVFGPDLMLRVIDESQRTGERHFFCGGNPGVAEQLAETLQERYPKAQFVGTYTPPFRPLTPEEEIDFSREIEESRPDIVWMGISTPKQEIFMQHSHARLNTKVMIGVGAAFDFHTGRLKDSPNWVKRAGLQWLHRLAQDPRRLWWRYLRTNTVFLYLAAIELLRRQHHPLAPKATERDTVAAAKNSFAD